MTSLIIPVAGVLFQLKAAKPAWNSKTSLLIPPAYSVYIIIIRTITVTHWPELVYTQRVPEAKKQIRQILSSVRMAIHAATEPINWRWRFGISA